jgi:uncharacterized membrane protein
VTAAAISAPDPRARLAVLALMAAYAALFGTICVVKHRFYLYDDFDLAIFTQALDRLLHGSFFVSIRGMNWLGDHSSFVLFLLAPIYAVFRSPLTLLLAQTLALALGALPVFWIARRELQHDWAAVACAALYLLYPALGFTNLFEFHPETLATPALLFAFHFTLARRLWAALAAAGFALLCREDVPLVVIPMGLWAAWVLRERPASGARMRLAWRWAIALVVPAVLFLVVSFGVLKPALNLGQAGYGDMYGAWGETMGQAMVGMLSNPLRAAAHLFITDGVPPDTQLKLLFHVFLLAPLLFLPLASPLTLALALPVLAEHMLSNRPQQHQIIYQYTALLTPVYLVAAIRGAANLSRRFSRDASSTTFAAAVAGIAVVVSLACNVLFGPVFGDGRVSASARPPEPNWPDETAWTLKPYRDQMMARVPAAGGVVAGFEFLSRLANRDNVHSVHHLMRGTYTYSNAPYPTPRDIQAVIADFAANHLREYVGTAKSTRLLEFIRSNDLGPAATAGDLALFLRNPTPPISLMSTGQLARDPKRVVFDGQLAFLGAAPRGTQPKPGGLLEFETYWMPVAHVDRSYLVGFDVIDAGGAQRLRHVRHLGYGFWPAEWWPQGTAMSETYRLVIPRDLPPGDYQLTMAAGWVQGTRAQPSVTDDPETRARNGVVPLGTFQVIP